MKVRLAVYTVLICFFINVLGPLPQAEAQDLALPAAGQMVQISHPFDPARMVGLKIDLKNPFSFNFIMDQGETPMSAIQQKDEFNKLIKYFLVSLTMPNKDMWVNLSPYESNRIVPEIFGQTEMGRDLLAQDYILKQFTASLMYPENGLGKRFWDKVYQEAHERFGTTDIKVNTFNKVWIVADKADVYQKGDTAFLVDSHLKVMMEKDYLAMEKHQQTQDDLGSRIVREIIIPAIEKEVNTAKNFATVRQVYDAEIMATWFKKTLRQTLLGQVFADKARIAGQKLDDPTINERIYKQYLQAYKKGVFNYIKEDPTPEGQMIPRKYFSGGAVPVSQSIININPAMTVVTDFAKRAQAGIRSSKWALAAVVFATTAGVLMTTGSAEANQYSNPYLHNVKQHVYKHVPEYHTKLTPKYRQAVASINGKEYNVWVNANERVIKTVFLDGKAHIVGHNVKFLRYGWNNTPVVQKAIATAHTLTAAGAGGSGGAAGGAGAIKAGAVASQGAPVAQAAPAAAPSAGEPAVIPVAAAPAAASAERAAEVSQTPIRRVFTSQIIVHDAPEAASDEESVGGSTAAFITHPRKVGRIEPPAQAKRDFDTLLTFNEAPLVTVAPRIADYGVEKNSVIDSPAASPAVSLLGIPMDINIDPLQQRFAADFDTTDPYKIFFEMGETTADAVAQAEPSRPAIHDKDITPIAYAEGNGDIPDSMAKKAEIMTAPAIMGPQQFNQDLVNTVLSIKELAYLGVENTVQLVKQITDNTHEGFRDYIYYDQGNGQPETAFGAMVSNYGKILKKYYPKEYPDFIKKVKAKARVVVNRAQAERVLVHMLADDYVPGAIRFLSQHGIVFGALSDGLKRFWVEAVYQGADLNKLLAVLNSRPGEMNPEGLKQIKAVFGKYNTSDHIRPGDYMVETTYDIPYGTAAFRQKSAEMIAEYFPGNKKVAFKFNAGKKYSWTDYKKLVTATGAKPISPVKGVSVWVPKKLLKVADNRVSFDNASLASVHKGDIRVALATKSMLVPKLPLAIDPGGIDLNDEHLKINIKVDGAGMPLPAQYQDAAMLNLSGLTSIIIRITPVTPKNVPVLFALAGHA